MDTCKRNLLFLLLSATSYKAFSCESWPPFTKPYQEKRTILPYIGTSAEEFLNQTYGENKWQFDDSLFIKIHGWIREVPIWESVRYKVVENTSVIPIEIGMNKEESSAGYTELTIYAEEFVKVISRGIKSKEQRVYELAKFRLYENAYPYVSTRVNLRDTEEVNIFCVFATNRGELVRVVKHPQRLNTTVCYITYYSKD